MNIETSEAKVCEKMLERTVPVPDGCNWITVRGWSQWYLFFYRSFEKVGLRMRFENKA